MTRGGLAYLAIYKPDLGVTEETVARQLLFYTAAPSSSPLGPDGAVAAGGDGRQPLAGEHEGARASVSGRVVSDLDTQLRNVGLVQGIVELGNSFAFARRPASDARAAHSGTRAADGEARTGRGGARDVGVQCITTAHTVSWVLQLEPPIPAPVRSSDRDGAAVGSDGGGVEEEGSGSGVWSILCMHTRLGRATAATSASGASGAGGSGERRGRSAHSRTPDTAQVLAELRRAYAQFRLAHGSFARLLSADTPEKTNASGAALGDGEAAGNSDGYSHGDDHEPSDGGTRGSGKRSMPAPPSQKALAQIERWWLRWAYGWRALQRPFEVSLRGLRIPALSATLTISSGGGDRARSAGSAKIAAPTSATSAPAGAPTGLGLGSGSGLSLAEWRRIVSICRQRTRSIFDAADALYGVVLVAWDEKYRRACLYRRSRDDGSGSKELGDDEAQALIDYVAVEGLRRRARSSHSLLATTPATAAGLQRPTSPAEAAAPQSTVPNDSTTMTTGPQQAQGRTQDGRSTSGATSWLSADRWVAETSKVMSLMSMRRTGGDAEADAAAAAAAEASRRDAESKEPEWWFSADSGKAIYLQDKAVGYNVVNLAHLQVILLHDLHDHEHADEGCDVEWAALLRHFVQLDAAVGAVLAPESSANDARSGSRSRGRAGIVAAGERDRSQSRARSRTPARGGDGSSTGASSAGHFYNLVHSLAAGLFWSNLPTIKHDLDLDGSAASGRGLEDGIGLDMQALAALADASAGRPSQGTGVNAGKSMGKSRDPALAQHERNVADNAAALHRQLFDLCAVERRRSARRRKHDDGDHDDGDSARSAAGDRADLHVVRTARNVWLAIARFDHATKHSAHSTKERHDPDLVVLARPAKQGETLENIARLAEREAASVHARFVEAAGLFNETRLAAADEVP